MEFKEGARIYLANGTEAGKLERVVIDPRTLEVTDLIARQGRIRPEEKVIPITLIDRAEGNEIHLAEIDGGWQELLPFQETGYRQVNDRDFFMTNNLSQYDAPVLFAYPPTIPTTGASYPPGGTLNDTSGMQAGVDQSYTKETRRNIDHENVALTRDALVVSQDGEALGKIERVFTDPESGQVTHFVITQGILNRARKLVPVDWVDEMFENEIRLGVKARFLDWLPDEVE